MKKKTKPTILSWTKRQHLKQAVRASHTEIREKIASNNATIINRTQAGNRKCAHTTIEAERIARGDVVSEQIKVWRSMLPMLIKRFSRIPDPRNPKKIKHKLVVIMMFGLLAFVFRMNSRREMNRELTAAAINDNLRNLFPELDSIPHADTLARLLKRIRFKRIEQIHILLIKDLICKKKFKNLLIRDCVPISVDGTQKLYRDGLLNDGRWLQRAVGKSEDNKKQQYIYTIEANITLKNGLNIPLLTEYLFTENNQLTNPSGKQDCELNAFERLAGKLKEYFPRLKIIMFMDALYATQHVMGIMHQYNWEYIISLPKNKLKDYAKIINANREFRETIPGQTYYRGRKQEFYWKNNIISGYEWQLNLSLAACLERREEVNKETGEIEVKYSEHAWISSVQTSINNVHELYNLGARKKELIEDSINTEKNRGYHYKHVFSYNWHAMQGFHLLMRLGHAINALSAFTKKLKQFMKEKGVSAILKLIKETLFSVWLSREWYREQMTITPQLRFQIE